MGNCNCTALGGGPRRCVRHGWTLTDRNRVDSRVCLLGCNISPSMVDHNRHSGYNWHAKDDRALRRSIDLELVHGKQHRQRTSSEEKRMKEKCAKSIRNQCVKEKRRESRSKAAQSFLVVANETMIDEESQFCFLRKSEDFNPTLIFK